MERDAFRALELDPRNPAPCTPLVLGLRALGDHAAAVEAARAMIENAPAAPIGYIALARAETGRGDPERMLEALRLAERCFDETTRNFRADAAERWIYEFERVNGSGRVEPGLAVMTRLALRDYATAQAILEQAIAARAVGMDPIPYLLIRRNTWADPVLEEPKWRQLRARLGPRGNGADA
jgi:tetratricopeptide (TPR) repeat protein